MVDTGYTGALETLVEKLSGKRIQFIFIFKRPSREIVPSRVVHRYRMHRFGRLAFFGDSLKLG